jgi:2-dehydro-3-deoxygluconokinase
MTTLLCIGEGMLELRNAGTQQLSFGFAGDTLNAAIYAKRFASALEVSYLTAVGKDPYSQQFSDFCHLESLNTDLLLSSNSANLGIYAIDTDDKGERYFYYWRKDSAATQVMELLERYRQTQTIAHYDLVFFSGLSMAILSDENKHKLLALLKYFKQQGSCIAFDPNYRPRMWQDKSHAIKWLQAAYAISDVILPGLDEHQELFGHNSAQDVADFVQTFGFDELIVKCGQDGVRSFSPSQQFHLPFNPAPQQVDSTAAGDSFAGTYLASRLLGDTIPDAVKHADNIARFVVQHPGAIVATQVFNQFLKESK